MDGERIEQKLRDYYKAEVNKVEPSPEWWDNAISRLGEQKQRSRLERPTFWKLLPSLITIPLSIFLLIVLVGSLFAGMGGMSAPPPPAPAVVTDGSGGSFMVWGYSTSRYERIIRAQHVDAQGNRLCGEKGQRIASGDVSLNGAVSDGNGGVVIAWGDRNGSNMKRMGSDGSIIWTLEHFTSLSVQGMVEDSSGGAILLLDNRSDTIYVQRVDDDGVLLWGVEGVLVVTTGDAYPSVSITGDGLGGVAVVWQEKSGTNMTIHAQRVSAEGKTIWEGDGLIVTLMADAQGNHHEVINDGMGNFIVAWDTGSITPDTDVYVQKLDEKGNPLWGEDGILVCKDQMSESYPANMQSHPQMAADGAGGVIVTWHDRRRILNREIFVQRISTDGDTLWTENGVWLWNIPVDYPKTAGILDSVIIADGDGGATIVWTGYDTPMKNSVIYAQRLGSDGQRLWSDEEVYDSPAFQSQGYSSIISDGQGGIIIGSRVGEYSGVGRTDSVYAQRIDSQGSRQWGEGGLEIQMVRSALTVQFIALGAILAAVLVLIGVFRRNRIAEIFTAIMPVLLGIAGLFSGLLVTGPFGYTYGWAYIPDTPVNQIASFIVPLIALTIGAIGISKKTVTLWVMIPVIVFCTLVAAIAVMVFIF
jgi:hypothetical protein